jgi:hypothetical protein
MIRILGHANLPQRIHLGNTARTCATISKPYDLQNRISNLFANITCCFGVCGIFTGGAVGACMAIEATNTPIEASIMVIPTMMVCGICYGFLGLAWPITLPVFLIKKCLPTKTP